MKTNKQVYWFGLPIAEVTTRTCLRKLTPPLQGRGTLSGLRAEGMMHFGHTVCVRTGTHARTHAQTHAHTHTAAASHTGKPRREILNLKLAIQTNIRILTDYELTSFGVGTQQMFGGDKYKM